MSELGPKGLRFDAWRYGLHQGTTGAQTLSDKLNLYAGSWEDLINKHAALKIENKALEEALSEYADRENWVSATGPMGGNLSGWCGKGKGWEIADTPLVAKDPE